MASTASSNQEKDPIQGENNNQEYFDHEDYMREQEEIEQSDYVPCDFDEVYKFHLNLVKMCIENNFQEELEEKEEIVCKAHEVCIKSLDSKIILRSFAAFYVMRFMETYYEDPRIASSPLFSNIRKNSGHELGTYKLNDSICAAIVSLASNDWKKEDSDYYTKSLSRASEISSFLYKVDSMDIYPNFEEFPVEALMDLLSHPEIPEKYLNMKFREALMYVAELIDSMTVEGVMTNSVQFSFDLLDGKVSVDQDMMAALTKEEDEEDEESDDDDDDVAIELDEDEDYEDEEDEEEEYGDQVEEIIQEIYELSVSK